MNQRVKVKEYSSSLIDKVTGSAFKRISTIATYEERKSINGK
jgi:hypothetical protein